MTLSNPIRVVLADDHAVLRAGLRALLEAEPDMTVVGEAANGDEAVEQVRKLHPDVIVMDLTMSGLGGLAATRRISASETETKVLVFTSSKSESDVTGAIQAGARGYLLKDSGTIEVIAAIRTVQIGGSTIDPAVASILIDRMAGRSLAQEKLSEVTRREKEILTLIATGMTNQQVGGNLNITEATVKSHLTNVYGKLNVNDRTEAVVRAMQRGLIELDNLGSSGGR